MRFLEIEPFCDSCDNIFDDDTYNKVSRYAKWAASDVDRDLCDEAALVIGHPWYHTDDTILDNIRCTLEGD